MFNLSSLFSNFGDIFDNDYQRQTETEVSKMTIGIPQNEKWMRHNIVKAFDETYTLADVISIFESNGDYNISNKGSGHRYKVEYNDFSTMSVEHVMKLQNLPSRHEKKLFATGRYQVIPATLKEAVSGMNLNTSRMYDETTQDDIFVYLISNKRPSIKNYIVTGQGLDKAVFHAALEWASIGVESKGERSYYGGVNKAHISSVKIKKILMLTHKRYQKLIDAGYCEKQALKLAAVGFTD